MFAQGPDFGAAELYRVIALVGLGRLDEARARLAQEWPDLEERPSCFPVLRTLRAAAWQLCRRRSATLLSRPPRGGLSPLPGKFQKFSALCRDTRITLASNHSAGRFRFGGMALGPPLESCHASVAWPENGKQRKRVRL